MLTKQNYTKKIIEIIKDIPEEKKYLILQFLQIFTENLKNKKKGNTKKLSTLTGIIKDNITSVELQHQALKEWSGNAPDWY